MTASRLRAVVALWAIAAAVAASAIAVPAGQARAEETDAISQLGGCLLARQVGGDVLFLMDQSASLVDSDSGAARVTAAQMLARSLADFAKRSDVDLSLAVSGFDVDFVSRSGWESVQDGSPDGTLATLESMRTANTGFETDYWNALEGARRTLRDRAAASGQASRCQAVVWFSDGKFELDKRDTSQERRDHGVNKAYAPGVELTSDQAVARATQMGLDSLCRSGGVADQVRDSGIVVLGVGLQGGKKRQDFGLMEKVSTGVSGSQTCGDIQSPANGTFTLASNIDSLLFAFDELSIPPPIGSEEPVCRTEDCPSGQHVVVLDRSVRRVRILAGSDPPLPRAVIQVRSPASTEPVQIPPGQAGETSVPGASITWSWSTPTVAEIVLTPSGQGQDGWSGVWSLAFFDPSAPTSTLTRANIHVEGDLAPALLNFDDIDWRVGGTVDDLQFGLTRLGTDDVVAPQDVVSEVSFSASLAPTGSDPIVLLDGATAEELTNPVSLDLSSVDPGPATIVLELDVTTLPAAGTDGTTYPGTKLAAQTVRLPVTLAPPAIYPTFPANVDFGVTEGTGPLQAELPVTGPGCVWLGSSTSTTAPEGAGQVVLGTDSANSPDSCLRVSEGQTVSLPLSLSVAQAGNGAATGTMVLRTSASDDAAPVIEQSVTYEADFRKPVNQAVRAWWFIVLGLVGTALPIALLWLVAWWQARIPGEPLLVGHVPVQATGGGLTRSGTATGLAIASHELTFLGVPESGPKRLELPGTSLTLATTARNPLDPRVKVEAHGVDIETSRGGDQLPLVLKNTWILARQTETGQLALTILLATTASDQDREQLLAAAVADSREVLSRWPASEATVGGGWSPIGGGGGSGVWPTQPDAEPPGWGSPPRDADGPPPPRW